LRVFVSWSGKKSRACAEVVRDWLPNVIQAVDPFISSEDIDSGVSWFNKIKSVLDECSFGIICLTKSNVYAPWLLYEAGALAHKVDNANVVPLLIDLSPSELPSPLSFFQAHEINEKNILKLVTTINKKIGDSGLDEKRLETIFSKWWPELESRIEQISSEDYGEEEVGDKVVEGQLEDKGDAFNELLELVRTISVKTDIIESRLLELDALRSESDYMSNWSRNAQLKSFNEFLESKLKGLSKKDLELLKSELQKARSGEPDEGG
tara:strand:+ start:3819 stop:4613 length:795 start_codon:yes stop_codon:yes gene_type:complete